MAPRGAGSSGGHVNMKQITGTLTTSIIVFVCLTQAKSMAQRPYKVLHPPPEELR